MQDILNSEATEVNEVVETGVSFSLIREGETLFTTEVQEWNPSLPTPISDFELTDAEGTDEDQVTWFVADEVPANSKEFKLSRVTDKVNEIWSEDDTAEMAKTNLPNPQAGAPKYPHVLRTSDGNPIIIKSEKRERDGVTTGQDKFGVFIRCIDTGEVMRVWTSDLHQTVRTAKAKKAHDKASKKKKAKAKPRKVSA